MPSVKLSLAALALVALCGCPARGVVCSQGQTRCGDQCFDLSADDAHCGECNTSCQPGEACVSGSCSCKAGYSDCDGACVNLAADPTHCGSCENACASGQVCEDGACGSSCQEPGHSQCSGSCVDLSSNAAHCGACEHACGNAQSCRGGQCTYDLVAACFTNGQVTGVQEGTYYKGPSVPLGNGPAAMAVMDKVLLSADGIDNRLYQARLSADGGVPFGLLPGSPATGAVPNQVLADGDYVYVVNAGSGTLQVLRRGAEGSDGGVSLDAGEGLGLATVAELNFGTNTFPQGVAKLGAALYVPLYGGFDSTTAPAGQKVAKVNVSTPESPVVETTYELSTLDLKAFDGGSPVPRPYAVLAHRGKVYVALNNLNADSYLPEGPGLLARIDPQTGALESIDLGADKCLNAIWLASDGTNLLVSCQGMAIYGATWALESVEKTGVVLLNDQDARTGAWSLGCPADAGTYEPDGGSGCLPTLAGRMALRNGTVYVADQNGGRLFVLEISGGQLIERRGYSTAEGPIQACAVDPVKLFSNVSEVVAVP